MKKLILSLALATFAVPLAMADTTPQIINVGARNTTSLDGQWKSIVDPFENGYYDYRLNPTDNGYAQDLDYDDPTRLQEYHFETDKTLAVPGDWNTQRPQLYYYEGTVWYRNRFDYDLKPGKRLFLHFGASNYETIVWLNGKRLGSHEGGFTPFNFEITDLVKPTDNRLVVKVDNRRRPNGVPTVNSDWWNYGGITRGVNLVETPETYLRDYSVKLRKDNPQMIDCRMVVDGVDGPTPVEVEIAELGAKAKCMTDENGVATFSFKAKPQLWSPESPKLYDVALKTPDETINDQIGFRTISVDGSKILLNGKPIFCRGVSIHEERPDDSGRAYSRHHAETLLGWAKEMNCNFVRLAHYPHNEEMVRAAERMGLLVWSEIPVYWTIHWDDPDTYANAERQLIDMITRDDNRCNIIIWSIANETPRSDARLDFLTRLATKARSLDNTRLIGAAMEKDQIAPGVMSVHDDLGPVLDIISFNEYVGWYEGNSERCDEVNWQFDVDKPVFISEFGGGALAGLHGDRTHRFTEEYQEDLYRRHTAMLDRIPQLAGTTPWILKDFRSPRRQLRGIQDDFNRKGLVGERGQKKLAFKVMADWYARRAAQQK